MHKNYDYIISGSEAMTKYFMQAYGYPKNKFLNYGLPRMDYLLNNHLVQWFFFLKIYIKEMMAIISPIILACCKGRLNPIFSLKINAIVMKT